MENLFISFGSKPKYVQHGHMLTQRVQGFTKTKLLTMSDVDEWFLKQNENIFSQQRGDGYWLWKPYIIYKELIKLNEGDILVYCDSLYDINGDILSYVTKHMDKDMFCSWSKPDNIKYPECSYAKGDALALIPCSRSDGIQAWAGFLGFRKTLRTMCFVSQWLTYCQDERIVTDVKDTFLKPHAMFLDNRHDQTVLSLLIKKWGIELKSCPPMLIDKRQTRLLL